MVIKSVPFQKDLSDFPRNVGDLTMLPHKIDLWIRTEEDVQRREKRQTEVVSHADCSEIRLHDLPSESEISRHCFGMCVAVTSDCELRHRITGSFFIVSVRTRALHSLCRTFYLEVRIRLARSVSCCRPLKVELGRFWLWLQ